MQNQLPLFSNRRRVGKKPLIWHTVRNPLTAKPTEWFSCLNFTKNTPQGFFQWRRKRRKANKKWFSFFM
jgi:hypothetical protein